MSFFFDVWTSEGFVLASDVRFTIDGKPRYGHKIRVTSPTSHIKCALVVCGDYPNACTSYFAEAIATKNSLREIAHHFATRWTERYSNGVDFSAVHLVGFEPVANSLLSVPQVWYWNNWEEAHGFYTETLLNERLETFKHPIPFNNHLPQKVAELTGKYPEPGLQGELELVTSFLRLSEPVFSWNGDIKFWRSAAATISSAMNLVGRERPRWTIPETVRLTRKCLNFLVDIGKLIPNSTVGIGPDKKFDVVSITRNGIKWESKSNIDKTRSIKPK